MEKAKKVVNERIAEQEISTQDRLGRGGRAEGWGVTWWNSGVQLKNFKQKFIDFDWTNTGLDWCNPSVSLQVESAVFIVSRVTVGNTHSHPSSEVGGSNARPNVGKLVVAFLWSAVYSTEPWPTVCTGLLCP